MNMKSMTMEELTAYVESLGEKPFRAKQLYQWMHKELVTDFDQMTNLSKALRTKLKNEASLETLQVVKVQTSKEDGTQKYLFAAQDGELIESVKMIYKYGVSVCVSSQVGCRMGCKFCASTIGGLNRSLTAGEILEQVYRIQAESDERVNHVVVMGMGEPFDNYDNVVRFLRLLTDAQGLNLSARNITVSTCGLVPEILRFAKEGLPVTLALSLHASNQAMREELLPIAKKYSLEEVLSACQSYYETTGRRVTFEYSLGDGVNDSEEAAAELAELLGPMHGHLNLIPINPVDGRGYTGSRMTQIQRFKNKLEKCGINVTIRRETGRDIDGACGQLRKRFEERQN